MRLLFNNEFYMYANDGLNEEKLTAAVNHLINNHKVQFKTEGFCDGAHTVIYLPGSNTPDYRVLDYCAILPNFKPLDVTLCEIYARLGLEEPELRSATASTRLRA